MCSACHGAAGISPAAMFPNLAGQHAEYLYWQLVVFKREARPESPMTSQIENLDDATMRDLAAWFASLPPAPSSPATDASSRGATLYREGDPAHGTPPCQGCHGADARGNPLAADNASYRLYPALRGQHADYVVQRLKEFRDGKHLSSSSGTDHDAGGAHAGRRVHRRGRGLASIGTLIGVLTGQWFSRHVYK